MRWSGQAVAMVLALELVNPTVTAAAANVNCGNVVTTLAGELDSAAESGYYSHLDPQGLLACTNQTGSRWGVFSFAAIQTEGCNSGGCGNSIVQIGRGRCFEFNHPYCQNQAAQQLITGWGRDPEAPGCGNRGRRLAVPVVHGNAPMDTGFHYYRVWDDGNSWWRFDHWPKGQAVVGARLINRSEICWTTREGATFNEKWNEGDALGGTASNHYNFISMTRQIAIGGQWQATVTTDPCDVDPGGLFSPYHCDVTGTQAWEAWTDR